MNIKIPNISKFPWKNIDFIIIGFCDIVAGLITILSFGFMEYNITMSYIVWRTKKMIMQRKQMKFQTMD